ncbi:MAG: FG-GAP-like repeat-containing protein [bacterium]
MVLKGKYRHLIPGLCLVWLTSVPVAAQNVSSGFCWVAHEKATGIALANDLSRRSNNVVTVGSFRGTVTFDDNGPNERSFQSQGGFDGFIAKYDDAGTLVWAKVLVTGNRNLTPRAVYNGNQIYVTGWFRGTATFGPGDPNEITLTADGDGERDVFLASYTQSGEIRWAKKFGGPGVDRAFDVYSDFGTVVIVGTFNNTLEITSSTEFESRGKGDIFVLAFDTQGNLTWSRQIGDTEEDRGYGIFFDSAVFVCGEFASTVVFGDGEANETDLTSRGANDAFVARFRRGTGNLVWAKRAGGPGIDRARDIVGETFEGNGLFVTGWFTGPADFDSETIFDKGKSDIFLARYDFSGNVQFVAQAGGPEFEQGNKVAAVRLSTVGGPGDFVTAIVTGEFIGAITFGEGEATEQTLTSNGSRDIYIAKYGEDGHFLWAKQIGGPGEDVVRGIDMAPFDYAREDDVDNNEIPNSFIAGGFERTVEFGGVPAVTSRAAKDIFATRLSDFIPPHDLTLDQVANTPYLKVGWGAPVNLLAPAISIRSIDISGSPAAAFGAARSTTFKVTIDYDSQTAGDDDVNQDTKILVVPVESAEGTEVSLVAGSDRIGGNGEFGQIEFDVLARFGFESEVNLTFAIKDGAGNVSNYLSRALPNPDALTAARDIYRMTPLAEFADLLANEPNCNASINLIGYNIYRDSAEEKRRFLGFVPAHLTMFVDEFTDPEVDYIYRVTAVYAEGESEHIGAGDQAGSPGADGLFDRIQLNGFGRSNAAVWGDYDNDNDLDLFVSNYFNQDNMLFRNDGEEMVQMTTGAPVADGGFSYSASWADYDNDGWLDLFVANGLFGAGRGNFLYRNNNGVFTRVETGLIVEEQQKSTSGVWGDYNNDGWLDLFVTNNVNEANSLYRNNSDGTFTKITSGRVVTDVNNSYHGSWVDYNDDGLLDLFVANNGKNDFYENEGPPNFTFRKLTAADVGAWLDESQLSQGSSWADYDNDGDLDLFISNDGADNRLIENEGPPTFSLRLATVTDINTDGGKSRGSSWADFDNDGDLDLFVSNLGETIGDPANNNLLYFNQGNGSFSKLNEGGQIRGNLIFDEGASNACSWADFNRDGFLDVIVTNGNNIGDKKNLLYRNNKKQGDNNNNWVNIRCIGNGVTSNRSALGAKVSVRATIGGTSVTQMQQISGQTGGGWGGQNSMNVEFGLGDATRIDELIIDWPSGQRTRETNISVTDQPFLVFEETAATFTVAGRVLYVNAAQSPIRNATVASGEVSDLSDASGVYQLTLPPATHTLTTAKTDDWGGVNSADALKVLRDFVGLETIPDGLRRLAADVNNSGTINSADAQRILQRFVGIIDSFVKPDWLFETRTIDLTANESNLDILGIASGDVNASYVPPALLSAQNESAEAPLASPMRVDQQKVIQTAPGDNFELPLTARSDIEIGALGLRLHYADDLLRFVGMVSSGAPGGLLSNAKNGTLSLAWMDATGGRTPWKIKSGQAIATLQFETLAEFHHARLALLPGSELSDVQARALPNAAFEMATVRSVRLPTSFQLQQNYPNPFNPTTTIRYDLKSKAHVELVVYDILGREVATLVDKTQNAGSYGFEWNAANLPSGVYIYRIQISAESEHFGHDRKLLLLK